MHYQEKVDQLFDGSLVANRTLRTLFDCLSEEWNQTDFEQKEKLLMKLYLSDEEISYYINEYCHFYTHELANKSYVLDTLSKSVRMLVINVKDELLRATLLKVYVDLGKSE